MRSIKTTYIFLVMLAVAGFVVACGDASAADGPFTVNAPVISGEARVGGSVDLTVDIVIDEDCFLYKDKTGLKFGQAHNISFGPAALPEALVKYDKFLEKEKEIYEGSVTLLSRISLDSNIEPGRYDIDLAVHFQGCSSTVCFFPQREMFVVSLEVLPAINGGVAGLADAAGTAASRLDQNIPDDNPFADKGLLSALVFAFLAGIGLSFTPCIYPMIPITVAIIGGQGNQRPLRGFYLSLIYVLGIAVVYSALGVAAASTGALFGSAVNSPWVVGFVAVVFVALAFSMFGAFELQLPTSMAEKFGGNKKGAGVLGIFFMGLVSGTVASPCVGPVLVSLLVYIASTGSKIIGFWLLFVFAWGMGLLLIAVGTFSGALKVLPKSGTWMVVVKKIMGVFLLGAALYYLRSIISDTIFLFALGIFLITVGIFSGGLDRLVAESAVFPRVKKSFGVLCLVFGIYFLGGTLLSRGLILSPFNMAQEQGGGVVTNGRDVGIAWFASEPEGVEAALRAGKPVMIDFWAEWCSVCKKLEKKTLADPGVVDESKRFVSIKVDCTDVDDPAIKALWAKYRIVGLPTIVFIDREGNVLQRESINGFVSSDDLKKIMGRI